MTTDEVGILYDNLSRDDQARFLVRLGTQITISIRGLYSERPQVVNSHQHSPVGNLNEIQHRVIGFIDLLIDNVPNPPSGKNIIDQVMFWAREAGLEAELIYDLQTAMERFSPDRQR